VKDEEAKEAHERVESVKDMNDRAVDRAKDAGGFTAKDTTPTPTSTATSTSPTATAKMMATMKPRVGTVKKPRPAAGCMGASAGASGKTKNVKENGGKI
jgi:hypothetical protein